MCIIIYTVYDPFRLYYEVYRLKDFSRTGARLFCITAAVLLILFLLPQLLIWLDRWMIKKNSKKAELSSEPSVQ